MQQINEVQVSIIVFSSLNSKLLGSVSYMGKKLSDNMSQFVGAQDSVQLLDTRQTLNILNILSITTLSCKLFLVLLLNLRECSSLELDPYIGKAIYLVILIPIYWYRQDIVISRIGIGMGISYFDPKQLNKPNSGIKLMLNQWPNKMILHVIVQLNRFIFFKS